MEKRTRVTVKGFLEGFIQGLIEEHKNKPVQMTLGAPEIVSTDGSLKPFHEALLPEGMIRINKFERSFSTKLGTTFEEVAKLVAKDYHAVSERGYKVTGNVSTEAISKIESIVSAVDAGGMKSTYPELIKKVVATSLKGGETRTKIADLHIKSSEDNEYFFEIKSPKPNKGQCLEATDRLLHIHAIKRLSPPRVNTFFAMAYNPYGDKKHYNHSFTKSYMDLENQVLIGKEFWDLVGGSGTYEEVLGIYREVGKEKGPDMIDQLALRY